MNPSSSSPHLLTFNCHEAWVAQLDALGVPFDIIDGLPGRYTRRWDERMRPVPKHGRLISRREAAPRYDAIIGHNLTDLLDAKDVAGPRLLVLHVSLAHRLAQAGPSAPSADDLREHVVRYMNLVGGHVVAVTPQKKASWGLGCPVDVVISFADADGYSPWTGEFAAGLRVANQITARREYLWWDLHRAAFDGLPVTLVGHNPDLGAAAAASWDDLKGHFARHRFFIHTAAPALEDGFNMAVMEAMAAGLPVIGNAHPTSPVVHGVSGLLSDDPAELRTHAQALLADRTYAASLGRAARAEARRRFSRDRFVRELRAALDVAARNWRSGRNG
ncbi:MAG: glycosyltransferase family 4 protein [Myxococcota bacterium]